MQGIEQEDSSAAMECLCHPNGERDADGEFSRHYFYSRIDNPNRNSLEQCLADLEGGIEAVAFSSGMAASLAVFQALAPGDHVVLHRDLYFGVRELVTGIFARWGLQHTFVDMRNIEELRKAWCFQEKPVGEADGVL